MDTKDVYETLDVLEGTLTAPDSLVPEGMLAELLMALTGTVVAERGTMAGIPTHDPDASAEARKTVLRWLADHGRVARPQSSAAQRYHELRETIMREKM